MGTAALKRDDVNREVLEAFGKVPEWLKKIPDSAVSAVWTQMRDFHLAETKIPNKYKELIGIAVSGATRCRYCTLFHTEAAKLFGATDDEIAEACMMSAVTMEVSTFLNASQVDYQQFAKETLEIVSYVRKQLANKPKAQPQKVAHA